MPLSVLLTAPYHGAMDSKKIGDNKVSVQVDGWS
jgi:hypothetical protein